MRARQNSASKTGAREPMPLAIIAAVAANAVIGAGNRLPWRLPEDLRRFRALTSGHAVIMGRKTWESLPGPLPDRQNIVVTRDPHYRAEGAEVATSLDDALARVRMPPPAFCIGGGELYRQAVARASTLYLTEIEREFAGDTTFPEFDKSAWPERASEAHMSEGPDAFAYRFVTRERRAS
jgi:dihydrofolate reductase